MNISKAKGYFLSGATGLVLAPVMGMAGPAANAADMKLKALPPPMAMPSWAGWYIGISAGVASQHSDFSSLADAPDSVGSGRGSSFIGGGHIGYNWQQGTFVYGLEADASGLSRSDGTYFRNSASTGAPNCCSYGSHVSWMATVRGRLGMTVGDGNTLVYGTGGVAFGHVNAVADEFQQFTASSPRNDYSSTRTGWVAGGGIERIVSPNVIVGLEGLFADFGNFTAASSDAGKCCASIHNTVAIGRARVSFKF